MQSRSMRVRQKETERSWQLLSLLLNTEECLCCCIDTVRTVCFFSLSPSCQLTFELLMVGMPPLWFVLLIGVRMQMLWQLECSVHTQTHTFFRHRGGMNWGEVSAGRLVKKDWRVGCAALFTLVGIFPARHGYKILFECGYLCKRVCWGFLAGTKRYGKWKHLPKVLWL